MMRAWLAPSVRDARTNSLPPVISVLALTSRAIGAMAPTPMASEITHTVLFPEKVMIDRASSRAGKASSTSMQPMRKPSVWPRMKPATRPMIPPKMRPKMIDTTPTVSDTRPPQTMREKMSRPRASVPNQCAELARALEAGRHLAGVLQEREVRREGRHDGDQHDPPGRDVEAQAEALLDGVGRHLVRVEDVEALELADLTVGDAAGAHQLGGHAP